MRGHACGVLLVNAWRPADAQRLVNRIWSHFPVGMARIWLVS
jgi:hypothetical protein